MTDTAAQSSPKVVIGDVLVAEDSPLRAVSTAVDDLLDHGLRPASGQDAAGVLKAIEREKRRLHAASIEVMAQIDAAGLHRTDGHASAQVQARHVARLSNGEALARSKTMRMLAALPEIKKAFWAGEIGIEQVQLLARVFANPRVRGAMELRQARFIDQAKRFHFKMFEVRIREWERLIDEDGPEPDDRLHRNRSARIAQDQFDLSWELIAKFASLQGLAIKEIFDAYVEAEWQVDWEKAVAEYGDKASVADMPRTHQQRYADALFQIFIDAAAAEGSAVPQGFTHNIVWSAETFEEMLRRIAGGDPQPLDPDTYTCQTIDGTRLAPAEAAVNAIEHAFRRVVIDARGVTLDMGERRFFTGPLRDAINIQSDGECIWPGCCVPATRCEADHTHDHADGGRTCPGNGAPLCGMHNRWKQKGYRIWRDPTGAWHIYRPDGTEIEN